MKKRPAVVGVADHCGWAVLMTVAGPDALVDRRRVELVDAALPSLPHHHECQALPIDEAVALIGRVTRSANAEARARLEALAAEVPARVVGISLRACPPLPETITERITNYRAQNVADSVMFRTALARAAQARGWFVDWYEPRKVMGEAARALGRRSLEALFEQTKAQLGAPWREDHRVAMAAAIAAKRP